MYYSPSLTLYSEIQEDSSYLPLTEVDPDPSIIQYYTIFAEPELTIYADHVTYTYFRQKSLETIKNEFLQDIQTKHEIDIDTGFELFGHIFDSNPTALLRITAVYTVANAMSTFEIDWIAKDNTIVHLTNEMIKILALSAMQDQSTKIITNRLNKDAVLACTTQEELLALPL